MNNNADIKTISNKPKRKKNYKPKSYKVTDEILFYKICDAGIGFTYLHGVNKDKNGNKVFYFDIHEDVREVIDRYNESEGK